MFLFTLFKDNFLTKLKNQGKAAMKTYQNRRQLKALKDEKHVAASTRKDSEILVAVKKPEVVRQNLIFKSRAKNSNFSTQPLIYSTPIEKSGNRNNQSNK